MRPSTPCSEGTDARATPTGATTWRGLFLQFADPEVFVTEEQVRALLAALPAEGEAGTAQPSARDTLGALRRWSMERARAHTDFLQALQDEHRLQRFAEVAALQSAPLGLWLGSWLQGMIAPGVCEDPLQLTLLGAYADDIGAGRPGAARREEFLRLLRHLRLPVYGARADELTRAGEIDDSMFALPCVLQALSRRSDAFHAEICAADLVLRATGLMPAWAGLQSVFPHALQWQRLDLAVSAAPDHTEAVLAHYTSADRSPDARFAAMVARAARAVQAWDARLSALARVGADPRAAMAELLRRRSREASVYHHNTVMDGCPLSQRFSEAAKDPLPLLDALSRSRFVRPGNAAKSQLVTTLIGPRGRMFRVFPEHELATMRDWIDHLPAEASAPAPADAAAGAWQAPPTLDQAQAAGNDRPPSGLREAYYLLQGRALPPALRAFAVDYVHKRLRRAANGPAESTRALPAAWTTDGLRPWLLAQHDLHGRAFEEMEREKAVHSREEVIRSTLQLAPLLLIDGAWLQGFTDLEFACSAVGQPLFEIFWDELGNGLPQLNHPKIYRDLLRSMGVEMAATGAWEFAFDARFDDKSFEVPVYWLCLGKLPVTFQPEILGMNLAMELSGVGDGYREASRFLRAHGFDTQFVDLHNTIDNVGTGHSGWAADAIDAYMSEVVHRHHGDTAAAWRRVRTGYDSLAAAPGGVLQRLRERVAAARAGKPRIPEQAPPALLHRTYDPAVTTS
ncbi:MAG: iron-containing redox enzyme family protein [Pseudomonadota bacterium]